MDALGTVSSFTAQPLPAPLTQGALILPPQGKAQAAPQNNGGDAPGFARIDAWAFFPRGC